MRADRLLSIMLMLQHTSRLTARELAQRLEVSPRTVHRDMEALSRAGIPVYAERGRDGGWSLLDSFRSDLNHLSTGEIQALFVNNLGILQDLGLKQAAQTGGIKLQSALPAFLREDAERVRSHILVDGASWRQTAQEHPFLAAIHDALWQGCKIAIVYQRADGKTAQRTVHPLGLVAKGRLWYLVAGIDDPESSHSYSYRTYRISRVQAVETVDEPAHRPHDFDLAAYWAASSQEFIAALPRYRVQVWASPVAVQQLPAAGWYLQIEELGEHRADGWQHAQLVFHTEETAIACLTGLGDQIEVIEPTAVRSGILQRAQAICAAATPHKNRQVEPPS